MVVFQIKKSDTDTFLYETTSSSASDDVRLGALVFSCLV